MFAGFKTTLITVALAIALVFALVFSQEIWSSWLNIERYALFGLTAITVLFAAQFNHSRLAWLSVFVLAYDQLDWLAYQVGSQTVLVWLSNHRVWPVLLLSVLVAILSVIKDRGLLSIHTLSRVALFAGAGFTAYGWLELDQALAQYHTEFSWLVKLKPHFSPELLLAMTGLIAVIASLRVKALTQPALLVTLMALISQHYDWLLLPQALVTLLLLSFYLLTVIISSYFLAYRDELTGLPSRRALQQLSLSLGRKYCVAMMDIDHFKKFNDTYGHDIGDQVLKLVASKLKRVGHGGKIFRYGGEEFTVVFPRKSAEQAEYALEQLRISIADYKMVIRQPQRQGKDKRGSRKGSVEKTVSVTISIGVATRDSKQNFEQVMKAADQKLYQAKRNGRNNVTC